MAYIKMKDIDDFTYFRNRISFQMRALGIHSTKALSEKLRETGFFKRTDSMGNIHLLKASSIDKIIQKHFQHNIPNELPDSLTANHVQAYANVLNCSTDFILGNTHTISKDIHIQDLCNRTGLTEASILNLSKIYDFLPCPFILTITLVPTEIFYAPQKNNIHLIKRIYIQ